MYVETKNQGGGLTDGPFNLAVDCGAPGWSQSGPSHAPRPQQWPGGAKRVHRRNSHPIPPYLHRRAPVPTALEMTPEPAILRRSAAAKFTHTGNAESAIGSQSTERFVSRCVMGRLFESRAHCSGHACARGWLRASRGGAHQPSSSPGKMPGGITSVPGRAAARRPLAFCQ